MSAKTIPPKAPFFQATNNRIDPLKITTWLAAGCATLVIIAAGVLGFTALYDLFISLGLFAAGWLG